MTIRVGNGRPLKKRRTPASEIRMITTANPQYIQYWVF